MSIRLPPPASVPDDRSESGTASSSDSEEDNDQTWDDWVSDSNAQLETKSLFDEQVLPSVERALAYDRETHKFDLEEFCKSICTFCVAAQLDTLTNWQSDVGSALDFHGRIRLVNYIRRNKPSPKEVLELKGTEPWFASDEYLVPVLENDPFIVVSYSDDWSDSEEDVENITDPDRKIKILEKKLTLAQTSLQEYRALIAEKLNIPSEVHNLDDSSTDDKAPTRDDDTHYFDSYGSNDIHAVMIQDKVRTSTYAHFILTNPTLFRDAVVLDVGCGTGILSLFAARAGAKRVIAVDASDIAEKAAKIVKANGFENVITVIRGKVENITLPEGIEKVDIIISEWMGYALLYESMLDSVLRARDRFLKPAGVMAPSQCKMVLGLCDATEVFKDRIGFWNDVYGFDMSVMAEDLYGESIVDIVSPETFLSKPYTVKDLVISDITPAELDFSSSFTLISTANKRTKISAFLLYFDTFFTAHGGPVLPNTEVKVVKEGEVILAELWPVGGKPAPQRRQSLGREKEHVTSFSTGPQSAPTHWKQTLFMLRDPITVTEGSIVSGTFMCKKSVTNSRELDVEIHYSVKLDEESSPSDTVVQMYTVR